MVTVHVCACTIRCSCESLYSVYKFMCKYLYMDVCMHVTAKIRSMCSDIADIHMYVYHDCPNF